MPKANLQLTCVNGHDKPCIPKLLVGARASARFRVWLGKVLKFPGRSGVLKLKRRKRRAPLPITSGCTGFITMQNIVIARPYRFVPPRFSAFWARIIQWYLPTYLRKSFGITSWECVGAERLRASLQASSGVLVASNHCRPCDPMVLEIGRASCRERV